MGWGWREVQEGEDIYICMVIYVMTESVMID